MSRSGPIGQAGMRAAARRPSADDTQPSPHWPPPYGEAPGQRAGQQPGGYLFPQGGGEADNRFPPAPEAAPNFGYPSQGGEQPPFGFSHQAAQQQGSAGPTWGQQGDGRGFDLGNYMSTPAQGYAQADAGFDPPPFAAAPHHYGETDAEYDEAMAEDEDEPRRGRRGLLIVTALVGAIGLGGGMAYAYKTFFPSRSGPAPLIKDTQGPIKSKPEVADGRGFAHTDKKLLNRLGDETGPQGTSVAQPNPADAQDERVSDDPNAPRKVRLIPISPNGGQPPVQVIPTAVPPAPASPSPMALPPGVTIDNIGPPRPPQPPSAARVQLPQPPPAAPVKAVPQPPVRIASAANVPPSTDAEPAAPAKKAPAAAKPAASKNPVPKAKQASAAPAATAASGAGYVAVLSSQKSRMDALKIFANMQEKYGEVLSSRTPDVQEANLGEKGVWYRLVVGPPGSRDAAASLCTQLKSAGYSGCWVTAY